MTRRIFALALLVLMPFGGMRVVCLGAPSDAPAPAEHAEQSADCEQMCPLHRPADSGSGSDCALTADASSLLVLGSTPVLPVQVSLAVQVIVSDAGIESSQLYAEPGLDRLSPPPKA